MGYCIIEENTQTHISGEDDLPLNEGAKEQPDGLLYVLCAQPTPLVLHQQTQNVQSNICHSRVCSTQQQTQTHGNKNGGTP